MKRLLAFLISLSIILTCIGGISIGVFAADLSSIGVTGTGTEADPFIIDTPEKFIAIFGSASTTKSITHGDDGAGLYYLQTKDLDLNGEDNSTLFVSCAYSTAFKGIYRGGDKNGSEITYSVKNIDATINTTQANCGLFPYVVGGEVSNISLTGSVTCRASSAGPYIGSIVARAETGATVKNCHNYATVTESTTGAEASTKYHMGGLIGLAIKSDVIGCSNQGNVVTNNSGTTDYVGGLVGYFQLKEDSVGSLQNCWNAGAVTAYRVGGIAGRIHMWSTYPNLTNDVVKNNYNTGVVTYKDATYHGGLAAYASGDSGVKTSNRHEFAGFYDTTGIDRVIGGWGNVSTVANRVITNAYSYSVDEDATFVDSVKVSKSELVDIASTDEVFADSTVWTTGNSLNPFPGLVGNPYTAAALNIPDEVVEPNVYTEYSSSEGTYLLKWTAYPSATGYNVYVADALAVEAVTDLSCDITEYLVTGAEKIVVKAVVAGAEVEMGVAYAFGGGTGEEGDPYLVQNITHLNNVRYILDANYKQTADITEALTNPIGTAENPFTGSYYGADNTHKTVNLNITDTTLPVTGMFAATNGASISYITTTGKVIGGAEELSINDNGTDRLVNATAGIVGYALNANATTISHCINRAEISKTADADKTGRMVGVAGIGGYTSNATISYCENYGKVNGHDTSSIGGIAGYQGKTITYCKNYGIIEGGAGTATGGISGSQYGNISYCANLAPVNGTGSNTGGISGSICGTSSITYSYNAADISGASKVGGIAGRIYGSTSATNNVKNCFNAGLISGASYIGTMFGYSERGKIANIVNCYDSVNAGLRVWHTKKVDTTEVNVTNCYTIDVTGGKTPTNGGTTITSDDLKTLLTDDTTFASSEWQVGNNALYEYPELKKIPYEQPIAVEKPFENGNGTILSPYQIATKEDFMKITDYPSEYFIQTANIEGITEPVCPTSETQFSGNYNGNGYSIDVNITLDSGTTCALFGYLKGKIENLTVTGEINSGATYTAGIVGTTSSGFSIDNCKNYVEITADGKEQTGGIVGRAFVTGTISNCVNYANISAKRAGGIVGVISNTTVVDGCANYGDVNVDDFGAGIVYWTYGSVSNSFNAGTITATNRNGVVSGIAGLIQSHYALKNNAIVYDENGNPSANYMATYENCYNIGTLNAATTAGIALRQAGKLGAYSVINCYNAVYADYPVCDLTDESVSAYAAECSNTDENTFVISGNFYLSTDENSNDSLAGTTFVTTLDGLKAIDIDDTVYSVSGDFKYPQLTANKLDEDKDAIDFALVTVDSTNVVNTESEIKNIDASSFYVQKGFDSLVISVVPSEFYNVEVFKNNGSLGTFTNEDEIAIEVDGDIVISFAEEAIEAVLPESIGTSDKVFTDGDAITISEESYTRYALVAAKAEKASGLKLVRFGVLISHTDGDFRLTTSGVKNAVGDSEKISENGAYGILIHSNNVEAEKGLKDGVTYYTRPYAVYADKDGKNFAVYGEVRSFVLETAAAE
ncbi:MAG: hypothetical protein E7411_06400 [Ruminococcaceae bacterium]|nr:hypothetical protein [Oscillospiraceae bacterium]